MTAASEKLSALYCRPGFLLRRLHQVSEAIFEAECAVAGLTPTQYGVLFVLDVFGSLDQTSVARHLGQDKVTVMHVIKLLASRGLLDRARNEANKRQMIVRLTAEGRRQFVAAGSQARRATTRILDVLEEEEQQQLMRLLAKWHGALAPDARIPLEIVWRGERAGQAG